MYKFTMEELLLINRALVHYQSAMEVVFGHKKDDVTALREKVIEQTEELEAIGLAPVPNDEDPE